MPNPYGLLSYESTDPAIVLRSSLTSAASITGIGGAEMAGSQNLYDPVLGMMPRKANGGTRTGVSFPQTISALAPLKAAQAGIEIQRRLLCRNDGADYAGATVAGNTPIIATSWGSSSQVRFQKEVANGQCSLYASNIYGTQVFLGNANSFDSEWAKVILSVTTGSVDLFIDGVWVYSAKRDSGDATLMDRWWLGNWFGDTTAWANEVGVGNNVPYFMRNFWVANKAAPINVHPKLGRLVVWGDSLAGSVNGNTAALGSALRNPSNSAIGGAKADRYVLSSIIYHLAQSGLTVPWSGNYSAGGRTVLNAGTYGALTVPTTGAGAGLKTDMDSAGKTRATAISESAPSCVCLINWLNQIPTLISARGLATAASDYDASLREHIEAWIGVGSFAAAGRSEAQLMVLGLPYGVDQGSSYDLVRDRTLAAVDWWNSTYPTRAGRVVSVDLAKYMGALGTRKTPVTGCIKTLMEAGSAAKHSRTQSSRPLGNDHGLHLFVGWCPRRGSGP